MPVNKLTFFPVANGDTTLLEFDGTTILTDINLRNGAGDDENDECYDIASDLLDAFEANDGQFEFSLDLFVLTHPDEDHLRGFEDFFHLGAPNRYKPQSVLIAEIWISPYCAAPNYDTKESAPVFCEINRRLGLLGRAEAALDGNRIKVMSTDRYDAGKFRPSISWILLSPTDHEADIPKSEDPEQPHSSNPSSLVIRWSINTGQKSYAYILGGDATCANWERVSAAYTEDQLSWHILLSPHHCSRYTMGTKDLETDNFSFSEHAVTALSHKLDSGFVVSSSKKIVNNDDDPPSYDAKAKYLGILGKGKLSEQRFLNPETHNSGKPSPVIFVFDSGLLNLDTPRKFSQKAIATGALSDSTTYGLRSGKTEL